MSEKLCLIVCGSFLPEVKSVIEAGVYPDVAIKSFNSSCIGAQLNDDSIDTVLEKYKTQFSKVAVIGGSCNVLMNKKNVTNDQIEYYQLSQCFELLLNKSTIDHLITNRNYLISNGWLKDYKKHIMEWGFDSQTAKKYFQESVTKLVLLDTGLPDDYLTPLQTISNYMGIPYEIVPVGLSHCKLYLDSIILNWREENERKDLNDKIALVTSKSADYTMAFSELKNLVDLVEEEAIVKKIVNLLNMLFAPSDIKYTSINDDDNKDYLSFKGNNISENPPNNNNFIIELSHQQSKVGVFEISGIPFPQYIERYKEVAKIISGVGGLAIANSRKYNQIKTNEESLKKYSEELKELIASRDKFFSIIAHDLRAPFSGLLGLTKIMAMENEKFTLKEFIELSESINIAADNLYKLLNNLLEWALLQQNEISFVKEKQNLSSLVLQSIEAFKARAVQKEISVISDIEQKLFVSADQKMVTTVLRNLLSNAIKFTHKGGTISVSAIQLKNSMIQVSVSDSGVGIDDINLNRLFVIGEKVSSKGTEGEISTGLGLILCKEFVEKHGGTLWVESKKNVGSTFYFTLPASIE